jgi:ribose transport system permease protein
MVLSPAVRMVGHRWTSPLGAYLYKYPFLPGVALATTLLVANLIMQPDFGVAQQLASFAPFALVSMASTPSILSGGGGIDLSVGPVMILVNILYVVTLVPAGLGGAVSVPLLLAVGAAVGVVNGLAITVLRLPPVVVTLSSYFIIAGINQEIAPQPGELTPNWTAHLTQGIGPVPGGLVTIAVPLLVWLVLSRTPFVGILLAVGRNDAAAFASGVSVSRIRIMAYALGGLFAAVGGYAITGLLSSADAGSSTSYTLVAIAGAALGGVSFAGGRGNLTGAMFGAASIYLLQSILTALNVSSTWIQLIYGALLIVAVVTATSSGMRRR